MIDALRGQEHKFLTGIIQGSSKFRTTEETIDPAGVIGIVLRSLAKSINLVWQSYSRMSRNKERAHRHAGNLHLWLEDSSGFTSMDTMISLLRSGNLEM